MTESLQAVYIGGLLTIIGEIGGEEECDPSLPPNLSGTTFARGIVVGSREQYEAMVSTMKTNANVQCLENPYNTHWYYVSGQDVTIVRFPRDEQVVLCLYLSVCLSI